MCTIELRELAEYLDFRAHMATMTSALSATMSPNASI